MLAWVSGNQIPSLCLGLDPYILLPKESVQLPDHKHTMDTRTCFLQNPYPRRKYPHSSKDTGSLPSDESSPFKGNM